MSQSATRCEELRLWLWSQGSSSREMDGSWPTLIGAGSLGFLKKIQKLKFKNFHPFYGPILLSWKHIKKLSEMTNSKGCRIGLEVLAIFVKNRQNSLMY